MSIHSKENLIITSPVFINKGFLPVKYAFEGRNINPPLFIKNIPEETKSLALIFDDADAPYGTFVHWLVWDISPIERIKENSTPGIIGKNDAGSDNYQGPAPSSGTHTYFFRMYALDTMLDLPIGSDKKSFEKAIDGHVLSSGKMMCFYKKVDVSESIIPELSSSKL